MCAKENTLSPEAFFLSGCSVICFVRARPFSGAVREESVSYGFVGFLASGQPSAECGCSTLNDGFTNIVLVRP